MTNKRIVRKSTAADTLAIFDLYKKVAIEDGGIARTESEITEGYIQNFLNHSWDNGLSVVVEIDRQIVGELHTYPIGPKIFEHVLSNLTVGVHPDFQGQGIGKQLFTYLLGLVETEMPHILRVELDTRDGNERAITLYQSVGFVIEGRLRNRDKMADGRFFDDLPMGWMNKNYVATNSSTNGRI
jgi:ribosomal protein S18 acetylase RimI-like enzyme